MILGLVRMNSSDNGNRIPNGKTFKRNSCSGQCQFLKSHWHKKCEITIITVVTFNADPLR